MTFNEAFECLHQGMEISNPTALPNQRFQLIHSGLGVKDQSGFIFGITRFKSWYEKKDGTKDGWVANRIVEVPPEIKEAPIGITPRYLRVENTLHQLSAACKRFEDAGIDTPLEILEEFYELNAWLTRYRINNP